MGCKGSKPHVEVGMGNPGPLNFGREEPMTKAEIQSRIESIERTESVVFGGMKLRYAYLSQRGYYPDGKFGAIHPSQILFAQVM